MNKGVIAAIIILILIVGGVIVYNLNSIPSSKSSDTGSAASSNTEILRGELNVEIKGFAFSPSEMRVSTGTKITWINLDTAPHTVTADSGKELDSSTLNKGQSYSHIFSEKGIYNYHCELHSGMNGKVVVE